MSFVQPVSNSKAVLKQLKADAKQYPKILSSALSGLAFEARKDSQESMKRELDRPTRFSLQAINYRKSTPRTLVSSVFVNPNNRYLDKMVFGGIRRDAGRDILIPARRLRNNAHGNITRARRRRLVGDPKTFKRQKSGYGVLLRRTGATTEYIGTVVKQTKYRRSGYWNFHREGERSYDRHFEHQFSRAYNRSIR